MQNKQLGQNGEDIAEKFLTKQGYKILERNRHFYVIVKLTLLRRIKTHLFLLKLKPEKLRFVGIL